MDRHNPDQSPEDLPLSQRSFRDRATDRMPVLSADSGAPTNETRTLELREERLVAHKQLEEVGEVVVRTEVEQIPGRLEVDAYREQVDIEHEPVNRVVREREDPWEEDDGIVVPVYEEQLVVVKRLVLKEYLRIRRVGTTERQLFEDTIRRDRVIVEDPHGIDRVHEQYPTSETEREVDDDRQVSGHEAADEPVTGSPLQNLVKRVLS